MEQRQSQPNDPRWPLARRTRSMLNWSWVREKSNTIDDIAWLRPEDLVGTKLPEPVVLVTGAFDLMHTPHMRLLFTARERAGRDGTVLVAMNSDRMVYERKGEGRPVMSFTERAAALAYMPIDVLVEFDSEAELSALALHSRACVQVCGPEYYGRTTTAGLPLLCIRAGGPHTTDIIKRIKGGVW